MQNAQGETEAALPSVWSALEADRASWFTISSAPELASLRTHQQFQGELLRYIRGELGWEGDTAASAGGRTFVGGLPSGVGHGAEAAGEGRRDRGGPGPRRAELFRSVTFPGPQGPLKGFLSTGPRRRPTPGHCLGPCGATGSTFACGSETAIWRPFREAEFVVMWPTWRGEPGNPGRREMFYGEAEDAVAAVKYVASLDSVDSSRVYLVGLNEGATIAMLAGEMTDQVRATIAFGGTV